MIGDRTLFVLQQPADFKNAIGERGMVSPVGGAHLVVDVHSEERKPVALLFEVVLLALARTIQSALHDERDDRVEFSAVQECTVSSAHIDHRSGYASKIDAVHHVAADDAGAITH